LWAAGISDWASKCLLKCFQVQGEGAVRPIDFIKNQIHRYIGVFSTAMVKRIAEIYGTKVGEIFASGRQQRRVGARE